MTDILVYLLDIQYEDEIIDILKGRDFLYHKATNIDEVVEICTQEFVDFILVWTATPESVSDLLTLLNMRELGYIPVIPVINKEADILPVLKLPVADVIQIPLPRQEFLFHIERNLEGMGEFNEFKDSKHWRGNLNESGVIDLIQMLDAGQRDAILTITHKGHLGQVFIHGGKIINAKLRNLDSLNVLKKLLNFNRAGFDVQFTSVDLADDLKISNQELLKELIQQLAEQEKYLEIIPDFTEDLIAVKNCPRQSENKLKEAILKSLEKGDTVQNLMMSRNEYDIDILKNVSELIREGCLVRRQDYELMTRNKEELKGLGYILNTISHVFKKNKKEQIVTRIPSQVETGRKREKPELSYNLRGIEEASFQKVQNFLKDL